MENQLSEEKVEYIKQILRDISIDSSGTSIIQDNKIHFQCDGKSYRCVMPSQKDQSVAEDISNNFRRENLGKYPTKTQYKKELKEKQNIDIDKLEDDITIAREKLKTVYMKMATYLSDEKEEIEKCRESLKKAKNNLIDLIVEINTNLRPCLDNKVDKIYHEYLTFACTEKLILDNSKEKEKRNKWVSAYNSFEEFQNDRSVLSNLSVQYMQQLLLEVRG